MVTAEYKKIFETALNRITYDMMRMKSKTFLPIGLEINSMAVYFNTNDTFGLTGKTMAYYNPIENSIHINIEDPFFTECTNQVERNSKLFFLLFHEAMHKILMHSKRLNYRKPTLWNISADYEIHNMLYMYTKNKYENIDACIIENYLTYITDLVIEKKFKDAPVTPAFLFDMKFLDKIAEEIYEILENTEETNTSIQKIKLSCNSGMGDIPEDGGNSENTEIEVELEEITYTLPDGKKHTSVSIKWPEGSMLNDNAKNSAEQNTVRNKALLENTLSEMVKSKGDFSAECQKFLKKLFHIKVDWEKILRNSLQTILDKSDYFAWNKIRTSAFLLPNMPYLPDIVEDEEKYGTLVIARDESGSMTDNEIEKAATIIMDAKAFYKKIVIIKHDTKITSIKEFEDLTDEALKHILTRESCGGTSHKEVFEFLKNYRKEYKNETISCFISITDMESDIETYQSEIPSEVPVIYLTPINYSRDFSNINGKIIPVES